MSDDNQIVRMAAAVFYEPAELDAAIRHLIETGISDAAISCWGRGSDENSQTRDVSGLAIAPAADLVERAADHLARGASILLVQAPTTTLHDKAVRTLLSHSHYPVHAEEAGR